MLYGWREWVMLCSLLEERGMDAEQIRQLQPFLSQFDDCFDCRDTMGLPSHSVLLHEV
jgi:hypothetical protein